jgi:hypothetical protein
MHQKVFFLEMAKMEGAMSFGLQLALSKLKMPSGQLVLIQTIDLYYSEHNKLQ